MAKSDWTAAWDQMEYSEDADGLWGSRTPTSVSSGIGARERSDMIAAVSLQPDRGNLAAGRDLGDEACGGGSSSAFRASP